jgi:hypothetical protein
VKAFEKIDEVKLVPDGKILDYELNNDRIDFVLPELNGHEMIEISYS